jgi:protein-S-isoprenylcysteine O-methyltransferase Ste14
VRVIATGGMPAWQIALIAAVAAVVAAIVAVLIDRAREERKMHTTTAA